MPINWAGVAIYGGTIGAVALGLTAWSVHVRRRPLNNRMTPTMLTVVEVMRRLGELWQTLFFAGGVFIGLWLLLNWGTRAVTTGQLLPVLPGHSPWSRLTMSRHLRPWNLYAMALLFVAIAASFDLVIHWPLRVINRSLRRVRDQLGISLKRHATALVADWRAKFLDASLSPADMLRAWSNVDDFTYISNRCWVLYRDGDDSKILAVSHGRNSELTRAKSRTVVWVCLYLRRDGRGGGLSPEARQRLVDLKFEVSDLPNHLRISDTHSADKFGVRFVREATRPDRLTELWRAAESAGPHGAPSRQPHPSPRRDAEV